MAAVARDRNTTYDGLQLRGAAGPPNGGQVVYVEIAEPDLDGGAHARVIDLPTPKEGDAI